MNDKHLKLTIKKKKDAEKGGVMACTYDVLLNDWKMGRNVSNLKLDMPAGERPKLTLEIALDDVDIEEIIADSIINEA